MPDNPLFERIEHNLTNHPPVSAEVVVLFETLRHHAKTLAFVIADLVPSSREQSLALTALEETVMWAVAGIARNQDGLEFDGTIVTE